MTYFTKSALVACAVVASSLAAFAVYAQTVGVMPAIYTQNNVQVNSTNSSLAAGYYYLANADRIYYFGNGTFYDQTSQVYGGTISDPSGMAGVALSYTSYASVSGTGMAAMPALYTQSTQVNTMNTQLASGYYTLASGQQVYYYGNGTYYNPGILLYGGSINDSSGMAGASLGYVL